MHGWNSELAGIDKKVLKRQVRVRIVDTSKGDNACHDFDWHPFTSHTSLNFIHPSFLENPRPSLFQCQDYHQSI